MGTVTVVLDLDKRGYSGGIADARRQARQLQDSLKDVGSHGASSMQAASASIRLLEGGIQSNVRAAERFVSLIPGVGTALQAAFPLVGAIAFGAAVVRSYEAISTFIAKAREMPRTISSGFESLQLSTRATAAEIDVTNDKLENEIAKLEHKPQNNMKLALDEAKLAADQFAKSIEEASKNMVSLIETNKIGLVQGFFSDTERTTPLAGTIKSYEQDKTHLAIQAAIAKNLGDEARYQDQMQQFHAKVASETAAMAAALADAQRKAAQVDHGTKVYQSQQAVQTTAQSVIDQNQLSGSMEAALNRRTSDQARIERDQKAAQAQEDAKKLAEAVKQAQELIVQQWRKNFDEAKSENDMTLAQDAQWWNQRAEFAKRGSLSYIAALDETNKLIAEMRKQNMTGGKEFDKTSAESYLPGSMDLSRGDTGDLKEQGRDSVSYVHSLNEQIAARQQAADAIAEQSLAMQLAAGQMSRLDAAQALATLHTQEFQHAQEQLQTALANAAQTPGMAGQAARAALDAQGIQMQGQRAVQVAQDKQGVSSQELGSKIALMAQEWQDMTTKIAQVFSQTVSSFNDDIAKAVTGQGKKGDFGKTFMQGGQGLIKTAIGGFEGMALGALHLGGSAKPDGTKGNPIYTIDAGGSAAGIPGGAGTSGIVGSLLGKIPGFDGSAWGSVLTGVASFLPHFAGGGDVLANHPSIVGERGPELFMPRTSGSIVPNHALGGGAGDNHFHFNIQGNQDPAAVEAAIRRAAPHIVAAAVQANHQSGKRNPGR